MDLHIVTMEGIDHYENIVCDSNWNLEMKNQKKCIERELVVVEELLPTINIWWLVF